MQPAHSTTYGKSYAIGFCQPVVGGPATVADVYESQVPSLQTSRAVRATPSSHCQPFAVNGNNSVMCTRNPQAVTTWLGTTGSLIGILALCHSLTSQRKQQEASLWPGFGGHEAPAGRYLVFVCSGSGMEEDAEGKCWGWGNSLH